MRPIPIPLARTDDDGRDVGNNGGDLIDCFAFKIVDPGTSQVSYTVHSCPYIHDAFKYLLYVNDEVIGRTDGVHGAVLVNTAVGERIFGLCRGNRFFDIPLNKDFNYETNNPNILSESDSIDDFDKASQGYGQNTVSRVTPLAPFSTNSDFFIPDGEVNQPVTDGRHVMFVVNGRVFLRDTQAATEDEAWPINDNVQYSALGGKFIVDIDWLDGYFVLISEDGFMYNTGLNNPRSIDALDFASAEANPDKNVGVENLNRRLYIFGAVTIENWVNVGGSNFPFERNNSFLFNVGCISKASIAKNDEVIFWVGNDGIVYVLEGGNYKSVSNTAIAAHLQESDMTKCRAFTYIEENTRFYSLTLVYEDGNEKNFTLDTSMGTWHERTETSISVALKFGRRPALIGQVRDGAVLRQMSYGSLPQLRRQMINVLPIFQLSLHTTTIRNFQIRFDQRGRFDDGGQVSLCYSDDDKKTFTAVEGRTYPIGEGRIRWNSLGTMRDGRHFKVSINTNRPTTLNAAFVDPKRMIK